MVTTPKAAANSRSFDAFVSMLFIGHCAAWSFLAVVMIRMPYSGMIWLMGPVLCTLGSLGGHCRSDRMCALFRNLALMGVLQFGFAALRTFPLLVVLAVPAAVLIVGGRDSGNNAGAVICASLLDAANGDVAVAADILFLTLMLALAIPLSGWLLDLILFGHEEWHGLGGKPPLDAGAVFRRMAAFASALALMYALDWRYGHWIPLTVALSYSGGDTGGGLRENFHDRFWGAAVGLAAALLWLGTVCYVDFRFSYIAALLLPAAFYYSIRTGDHMGFCIMYMMICGTLDDLIMGPSSRYGDSWQLFFQSAAGIVIGAGIVGAVEAGAAESAPLTPRGNPPRSTAERCAPDGCLSAASPARR